MPGPVLRRGQLQIGESMIVIILILIIGVFALVFFANMTKAKYQVRLGQYEDLNAVETAHIVNSLYELRCAKTGATEVCVDKHKALAFAQLQQDEPELVNDYYFDLFRYSRIELQEIYPEGHNYTLYEVNASSQGQVVKALVMPVAIYNNSAGTNSFGILSVERFYTRRSSTT
ncbi:hypothetical protein GF367_02895 [Candidatus Woesearchaeota archaeon]|nr:hypothetical protein [Candidatus Woesearchaeota archaeon]